MNRNAIEDFGPYQDALVLFDHVVSDMAVLRDDPRCYRLIGQQVGSADSICANMDEGFGRLSRAELVRFFDISRGSARETRGRYKRLKHWLPAEVIGARVALADRIIARLTKSITTLRDRAAASPRRAGVRPSVRESGAPYGASRPGQDEAMTDNDIEKLLGM